MLDETPQNAPQVVQPTRAPSQTNLSQYLSAAVFLCDKEGNAVKEAIDFFALEADLSIESQYSSPFENSNPEQRLPTLLGMMQSGDWVGTGGAIIDTVNTALGTSFSKDGLNQLNAFEGKSNFTKVNSTQIYVASQPIKINLTGYLQAWASAKKEVELKLNILSLYAMPGELANSIAQEFASGEGLNSFFPSTAPPFVGLQIANKTYLPMILESISSPLITPFDKNGNRISVEFQMTFMSRQAWDQRDLNSLYMNTF